ncbi:TetR/AcrR family transcriptional regulator [Actinoplanes couchii]|uniref:TetR family transcriptional regulator n=1 Tax=Actinoplanes couchii TaxID=403638 RepID=A0ABQ3XNA3_9ACTN|nr:TetR/AcrR family transcriptional regulator [Actinoplanes couchii]MDR6318089.1 AcrR family transcriptional regulator [Actinoplanes couchii]GID59995.1 TetR family transcriptional regulator [Actinoplanes couchii]
MSETGNQPRRRLSKAERHTQLLDVARELIRDAGTDELTLGRLAERAGVTKPLVYDHFGDRAGLLTELYRAFEDRQRDTLRTALDEVAHDLPAVAGVVAAAYIDCCLAEGRELADVVAALAGSSELSRVRQEAEEVYLATCRTALEPFCGPLDAAALHAFVGAGDALARNVLAGRIAADRARRVLARVITAITTEGTTS